MAAPPVSEADFVSLFKEYGAEGAAVRLGISVRNVHRRRVSIEKRLGIVITNPNGHNATRREVPAHPGRLHFEIIDGNALIGSDAHYWACHTTTAHRAFCHFSKRLGKDLKATILNGDVLDGASISRHAPLRYEKLPSVQEELEACQTRLDEIVKANPKARRYWPFGNHDSRYEVRLATQAPQFAEVAGFTLREHFPLWEPCWSVWINDDVVVKHRFKGGIHSTHNGTMWAGKTMVNGHLHSLKVTPFTDYRGTRFGVDTGTLADPYGPQFAYCEDNPVNWRSGFVVLTFVSGKLLWPEVVHVIGEGRVEFRGEIIDV